MSTVTFENVFHGDSPDVGKLRFNAAGFGWKSYENEESQPTTFSGSDLKSAAWLRVARNFQLRLTLRQSDRPRVTFDGFKREDFDKVKRTLDDYFHIKVESRDAALRGWNWGKAVVQGHEISFQVQNKTAFEVPLSSVSNSNIAGKNEVALEFTPSSTASSSKPNARLPDELVEMRFYIPGKSMKKAERDGEGAEDEEEEEETDRDEDGNEITAAEAMHNLIKDKADIGAVVGESIVVFEDVLILTPRGRYSLEFFQDSLRLLGKSTDYRLPYSSLQRMFLIPKLDDLHVQLVIGLDPPIRQGATRYPFLVAQWPKDEEVDAELNLTDEDIAKYPDLQRKYEAPTFQVISRVLKSLTGKKVTPPGTFKNAQGMNGIKANVKAVQGELYLLEKSLIFIAKQPILIDYSKTASVSFSRVGGGVASAKTFDMRVVSRTDAADHVFSAISKEEVQPISTFFQSHNVRLKNEMDEAMEVDPISDDEDEDEDEEMSIASDNDQGKGKGGSKPSRRTAEDDEESEDEDFRGDESSDGGSPSESDSDAESGDVESDASDPMMEEIAKRQAGKSKKAEAAESDEEGKPKKKRPKQSED